MSSKIDRFYQNNLISSINLLSIGGPHFGCVVGYLVLQFSEKIRTFRGLVKPEIAKNRFLQVDFELD